MTTTASCPPVLGSNLLVPDEFVALEAAARAALEAARRADEWDPRTRTAVLAWLAKHRDQVAVVEGRVLTAEQAAGTWALTGDRDLATFAGRVSHQGRGSGFAAVGQAATLAALPAVADALVDGPVTTRHVSEITRVAATSPALAMRLATDEGQAQVVQMARRFDGAEFGQRLRQLGAALDPASRQRSHDQQRADRYLHISHTPGGTLIKAQLDSVAGYRFGKAIDALNPRPAKDDVREGGQRRADALMVMVERTLTDAATTPGAVAPVQAVVTIDQQTWAALRAARDGASPGSTSDVVAALSAVPPVVDETGRPWPASEVAKALCDCLLTRALVDAEGQVLDLGLGERFFKRSHWLALLASGQTTCAVAACAMPLRYTQLHHMDWWFRDDGPTQMANCAPECAFHHEEIHRYDIRVSRRADGTYEHFWPDGRPYGGTPPQAPTDRPPVARGATGAQ